MVLIKTLLAVVLIFAMKKMLRKVFPLDCHFVQSRVIRTVQFIVITCLYLFLLDAEPILYSISVVGAIIVYTNMFIIKKEANSKLVTVPNMFDSQTVALHLASNNQSFDKETYRELKQLIRLLKCVNVKKVTLCSPMFFKDDEIRNTNILHRYLSSEIQSIESREISFKRKPLAVAYLLFNKHIRKTKSLQKLNIFKWYQFDIYLT